MTIPNKPIMVDADTHVLEPPDVWTKAVPAAQRDLVPHVRRSRNGYDWWFVGEARIAAMGEYGMAGSTLALGEGVPKTFDDIAPETWDVSRRLVMMDEHGVHAQVLYPNVGAFALDNFSQMEDRDLGLRCVQVYNDWVADWARPAKGRLVPIALLPIWDLDATLREMNRAVAMGHKGVLFPQHPMDFGLAPLNDPHWDPIWQVCQERKLPVNFHIGVARAEQGRSPVAPGYGRRSATVLNTVMSFSENISGLADLMLSGILPKFPDLRFVSVESGVGYIPYLLEACDWQFQAARLWEERPEFELLPSEYFRRQVFVTYWFERASPQRLMDWIGPERVMLETDFPHPTSLWHASGVRGVPLAELIDGATSFLTPAARDLVMWRNAAELYDVPPPAA